MRDVINKRVTEEEVLEAAESAFSAGYSHIKLYFMIGLPGETDEDVLDIAGLASRIREIGRKKGKRPTVVVSVSGFVPKPHTPFQWEPAVLPDEIRRRQRLLRNALRGPGLEFRYHDSELTALEAVFARETGGWEPPWRRRSGKDAGLTHGPTKCASRPGRKLFGKPE
jgi:radical SAM superfamily enzyme YgiQ (UPF0313 family)